MPAPPSLSAIAGDSEPSGDDAAEGNSSERDEGDQYDGPVHSSSPPPASNADLPLFLSTDSPVSPPQLSSHEESPLESMPRRAREVLPTPGITVIEEPNDSGSSRQSKQRDEEQDLVYEIVEESEDVVDLVDDVMDEGE